MGQSDRVVFKGTVLEELGGNHVNLKEDISLHSWDSKCLSPEYKSGASLLHGRTCAPSLTLYPILPSDVADVCYKIR